MTAPTASSQEPVQENKTNDKELNFRMLEAKYQKQLAQVEAEKQRLAQELENRQKNQSFEEDDDDEPYIDKKKLKKHLSQFGQETQKQTQSEIQRAVQSALHEERKQNWIKQNNDFHEVLQHAEKLAQRDPDLAESILEMPEGFERQKLVYKNIKALGLHKPEMKQPSIQDKIDANRRSPYYQPTGVGAAPYSSQGDFSHSGQKQAYEKMQELKSKLRI